MHVVPITVPQLGNRCHLVHDGVCGLIVDAPRDVTAIESAADELGVQIVAVGETHVHNDYVSGGPLLAKPHRADYLLSAEERVDVERGPHRPRRPAPLPPPGARPVGVGAASRGAGRRDHAAPDARVRQLLRRRLHPG